MIKNLQELINLNLPENYYAIFGSGPLAVRDLRESNDIDLIVTKSLWDSLLKTYSEKIQSHNDTGTDFLSIGSIEIYCKWFDLTNRIDEMISSADLINGLPFVKLEYVLLWKMNSSREKDINDVKLINDYLKMESNK